MKEIKLFDYQEDMKERIEKALRLHRSVMAQMPTGTGKTYLLTAVIESFCEQQSNGKVWIVAHRRELVSQITKPKKVPFLFRIKHLFPIVIRQGDVHSVADETLRRDRGRTVIIVIDEAHHALAKTYKEMWERFPNAKFLGLRLHLAD